MKCRYWLWRPLRDRRVYPRVTYRIPVGVICQFSSTTRDWGRGIPFVGVTCRNASFVREHDLCVWKCSAFWKRRLLDRIRVYWIRISGYIEIFFKVLSLLYLECPENVVKMLVRHLNAWNVRRKHRKDVGKKFYIGSSYRVCIQFKQIIILN